MGWMTCETTYDMENLFFMSENCLKKPEAWPTPMPVLRLEKQATLKQHLYPLGFLE